MSSVVIGHHWSSSAVIGSHRFSDAPIEFYYDLLYHNGILCFLEPNMSQFYHIGGVFPGRHWSSLVIIGRHRLSLAVIGFQTYPPEAECAWPADRIAQSNLDLCSARTQRIPYCNSRRGGKLEWNICDFK